MTFKTNVFLLKNISWYISLGRNNYNSHFPPLDNWKLSDKVIFIPTCLEISRMKAKFLIFYLYDSTSLAIYCYYKMWKHAFWVLKWTSTYIHTKVFFTQLKLPQFYIILKIKLIFFHQVFRKRLKYSQHF